eukprot:GHVO01037259.1.p3 GENE.GHVO01037259.1~~GHVO01037259.1.p3  ORF type:complete len:105 (-),score=4.35 GHVO01037259.1:124-438(-)
MRDGGDGLCAADGLWMSAGAGGDKGEVRDGAQDVGSIACDGELCGVRMPREAHAATELECGAGKLLLAGWRVSARGEHLGSWRPFCPHAECARGCGGEREREDR